MNLRNYDGSDGFNSLEAVVLEESNASVFCPTDNFYWKRNSGSSPVLLSHVMAKFDSRTK